MLVRLTLSAIVFLTIVSPSWAEEKEKQPGTSRGDKMIAEYFRIETAKLADRCLTDVKTLDDWTSRRDEYVRQLREMLGLDPWPERGPLEAQITGKIPGDGFTVEKIVFQSLPGLYVTGNLYLPAKQDGPLPTILYACGHHRVKEGDVSYGNKTWYQHHGEWFARNGYVCLTIDSLQLGEIEGVHRGASREGMWWWNSRGYTPAGVEAWNCIRALDYLETRPEVDKERFGMTGRSGGGVYTWWVTAIDPRIKVAVPVAGITDLQNYVVDGMIAGHCDCMFMVNTYRWDYPQVAALVAPRPLLIANTDKDHIFPLDGVIRTYEKVRTIYDLYGAGDKLGLQISEGDHFDIQELQVAAFRWFNRFLKEKDEPIRVVADKFFEAPLLKVLDTLPADQINTTIQEKFVPRAEPPKVPESAEEWATMRDGWMKDLREKVFAGWPEEEIPLDLKKVQEIERDDARLTVYEYTSQPGVRLTLYDLAPTEAVDSSSLHVDVLDETKWQTFADFMIAWSAGEIKDPSPAQLNRLREESGPRRWFIVVPRGIGPTQWTREQIPSIELRRRFMLVGQTWSGMQVWDVLRALRAAREITNKPEATIAVEAEGPMAMVALFASLFDPSINELQLTDLPTTLGESVDFLNILKYINMPQAAAMAADRTLLNLTVDDSRAWEYPAAVSKMLPSNGRRRGMQRLIKTY